MGRASAGRLKIGIEAFGHSLEVHYTTDCGDDGALRVRYPDSVELPGVAATGAIGLATGIYLGQLCLAQLIELDFAIAPDAIADAMPLAEMLYDIRRWKDDLPPAEVPEITARAYHSAPPPVAADKGKTVLLWSGGKDSTLSALLLQKNQIETAALHFAVNSGVSELEQAAVDDLSRSVNLRPIQVIVSHPEFLTFSSRYAINWNVPPLCNTVPFGRDLLLAMLAVPVAEAEGARYISMGHDFECRTSYVSYGGKKVPRNDVESVEGARCLEQLISRYALTGAGLLAPVSNLSELQILRAMLVDHPDLMARTSFCFWGGNCGQCAKCLRYYLAQRLFGGNVLSFRENPLGPNGAPELDDVLDFTKQGILFQDQVLYCMGRLIERDDVHPAETRLAELAKSQALATVLSRLNETERYLMRQRPSTELPVNWKSE